MELLGPGTVEKRGKTRWRLRVTIKDNKGRIDRLDKSVEARNKTEAKLLLDQWKHELVGADLDYRSRKITVKEYLEDFLEYCRTNKSLSKTTLRGYTDMANNRLIPYLGDCLMIELTPYQIEEFFKEQLQSGGRNGGALSASTCRKTFSFFKTALKRAVYLEIILRNPCELLSGPSVKRAEKHSLSEKELARMYELMKGCPDRQFAIALRISAATGMRRGEICGLTWDDIDLDKGIVDVNKALIELNKSESKTGKASVEIKETKTTGSTRKITLDHDTVEFLKAEKEAQRLTLAFYHVKQTGKTPVACDFRGNWYRPSCFTSAFIAFRNDHGFDGIRLHDLRHTQATLLLKNGENIHTVSRRLSHAKASTTLDVYGHVLPGMDKEAAELFGNVVARAGKE